MVIFQRFSFDFHQFSMAFHRFSVDFNGFHWISMIFNDFQWMFYSLCRFWHRRERRSMGIRKIDTWPT